MLNIHVSGPYPFGHFRVYSAVAAINSKSEFPVNKSEEWLVKMLEFQVSVLLISTLDSILSYTHMQMFQNVTPSSYMRMLPLRYNAHRKFKFGERM